MAISPDQEYQLAVQIRRIYEDAQLSLLRIIARRLVSDGESPDWANIKLAQLSDVLREARRVTNDLDKRVTREIEKVIELAYASGNESAATDLKAALQTIIDDGEEEVPESVQMALFPDETDPKILMSMADEAFGGINTGAVEALAGATTKTLTDTHVQIVRAVDDIYRKVVTDVAGSVLTGSDTRREATQRILDDFANGGFKTFRDKRGRNWEMASYAEMATRSAVGQASIQGHIDQMKSFGFELVQVSDHAEECDLCRPWEGKVLTLNGNHPKYKTLDEAIAAGLFHPNCGHRLNTYFEGITKPLKKTADPVGSAQRQHQRYLERGIRKWKKRQAVAMTPEAERKAKEKLAEWSAAMNTFIDETGRKRKRGREQIARAR
jgi:hypothetical protein